MVLTSEYSLHSIHFVAFTLEYSGGYFYHTTFDLFF